MSDQLKNLLSDIVFENELSSSSLHNILKACNELQNFKHKDTSSINQIISNLNANINVQQNHQLLNTVIQQCTEDLLVNHAITWMSLCIKSNDNFSASIGALDYTNLNLLVSKTSHSNDVKKQFIASVLPKFMLKLNSVPSNPLVCREKLKCLESVLRYYNGPCFSHYKTAEKFLLNCVEQHHSSCSSSAALTTHIGLCYTLLSQLGGGGHQTSLYKDNWTSALVKLVACTHKVLDQMFEDVPEIQTVPVPISIRTLDVTIPFLSYYPNTENTSKLHASTHLLRAFKVLSTFIRTHLGAPFPAPKTINVEAVLSVVARVLSITPLTLSNLDVTSGHAILLSLLPEVHAHAHAILNTLVLIAGRNLIPHSLYICKLTVHTLKWTNSSEADRHALERPYRELRCAAYKTLHSWLTLAGYASNIELVAEELIDYLLADIVYEKQGVTLTTVMKKTRKRHKTKVGLESVDNKSMQQRALPISGGTKHYQPGDSLCAQAHRILADVLGCAGSLLKPDLIQSIQTTLAGLLLPLSTGCRDVYPYSTCAASRLALYSTLESCLLYSNPRTPDLAHYASVFYRAGLTDGDVEIRKQCQRGIEILEKIQHPKADSLNFVLENLEEEKLKLLGPYVGKVNLVGQQQQQRQTNGHGGGASEEEDEDDSEDEEMSEPAMKKGKQIESGAATPSGKGNKEQTTGSKQGKKDGGNKQGKQEARQEDSKQKKRKRNELNKGKEDNEDSEDETDKSGQESKKKKLKTKENSGKEKNKKTSGKNVDEPKNGDKGSKTQDKKSGGAVVKEGTSKMSKALAKIANKPANFISLEGFSDSSSSSDDSSEEDFEGLDDSDGSENGVAMMLMNAMMGGNNSDFSFDDDDDEDEDEEDDDGEEDDSSIFEDDDDDDQDSESEMETSSSEDEDRPGVIITEIVDEELIETDITTTTTSVGNDKESGAIETSKTDSMGKRKENDSKSVGAKHVENMGGKTRNASESSEANASKGNKSKKETIDGKTDGHEEATSKDGKSKTNAKTKLVKTNSEATKIDSSSTGSNKPYVKGKVDSRDTSGKNEDKKKHDKDVGRKNNGGKTNDNIDCIDLGESDDSDDQDKTETGTNSANKTSGNKEAIGRSKGKTITSSLESEEIVLSSDNSQDSTIVVKPLKKTGKTDGELVKEGIDEDEEESEGEEEIDECLKLFSVE
uniref:Proline-, glutamic acid- and leucine-rich protein 1 n=1 Tax=Cacopsylla melanoneura TaxID=428564 RepID=A0A8D8MFA5_9HEMI